MKNNFIERNELCIDNNFTNIKISPDGKMISYLICQDNKNKIAISKTNDLSNNFIIEGIDDISIMFYGWAYTNEHILYMVDSKGNEDLGIYCVNIKTKETKKLTYLCNSKIIGISHKYPNRILAGIVNKETHFFDIYNIDIITGEKYLFFENKEYSRFIIDNNFNLIAGIKPKTNGGYKIINLIDKNNKVIEDIKAEDTFNTYPIMYNDFEKCIYMRDSSSYNTSALVKINLDNNYKTKIISFKDVDIGDILFNKRENKIEAVLNSYQKKEWYVLEESIRENMKFLQNNLPGFVNVISRTLDDTIWLISCESDISPKKYYIYYKNTNKLIYLFKEKDTLYEGNYCEMKSTIIKSNDGLNLLSYYTIPKNNNFKRPLPAVILVHGGPWHRDSWGFNYKHQWLANRGYFVMSINFRGSRGFGKEFLNIGKHEWGRKMHQDIVDCVEWAINKGYIDKQRIAIMGGSYGGYETLMALALSPNLFSCGICKSGIFDVVSTLKKMPSYWVHQASLYKKYLGDLNNTLDYQRLVKYSPINNVDKIKNPLLILHGENDIRTSADDAEKFVNKLLPINNNLTYVEFKNEGHSNANIKDKVIEFALIEKFLHDNIGGLYEDLEENNLGSFLKLYLGKKIL